jgi:hypothetical protein
VERGWTEEWRTRRAGAQAPRWRDPTLPCECESPRLRGTRRTRPQRRRSGDGEAESGEPRAETGDGGDGRSRSGEERSGRAAEWVRGAIGN